MGAASTDPGSKPHAGARGLPAGIAGRRAGVRAQVHLGCDRLGTGRHAERHADRRGSGRLRTDGLGGARARLLRLGGSGAPRAGRRRSRACPRRTLRPGDRPEHQHRAAGLGKDVRPAARRLQRRTRLESAGRPGAGAGAATLAPRLRRGGAAAGRARARARPPRPDPRLPAPACRARHGTEPDRCRRRPA